MKKLSYMIEAAALWLSLLIFRLIGPENASNFGGWVGRTIGPRLAASRKARKNLENAFPDWSTHQIDKTVEEMWDNLGRVMAEYPHLKYITMNKIEIEGAEHIEALDKNLPLVTVGAHLANWELFQPTTTYRLPLPMTAVYREPNNPYAAMLLQRCRHFGDQASYVPKSASGTRALVTAIRQGGCVGILIDQKYNEGIPVDFFGRPAMTSVAPAQLARKYNAPIVPMRIVRDKTRFRLLIEAPIDISGMDDGATMLTINRRLEGWIKEHPGQWLWLHRRWDSKALQ